jgi:FtsZ-interacting cell division protein ZipA
MTKTRVLLIVGAILIGAAYLAGFWPERRRLTAARTEVQTLQERVSESDARVRLGEILGQLLTVSDALDAQNYGDAAARASAYFDRVAAEAQVATSPAVRAVLEGVQQTRDAVTAGLARAEPAVRETLRQQQIAIRRALGYEVTE